MYSSNRTDVLVRHEPREVGSSNYGITRILRLVFAILFSYSLFPLRAAALAGFAVALVSFLLGAYYLVRSFFVDTPVRGLDDHRGAALDLQRRDDRAALDARRVRRAHPQRGQRAGHLPRHGTGLRLDAVTCSSSARSGAGRRTSHSLLDAHPEVTMARPRASRAEGLPVRRRRGAGRSAGTGADLLRARRRRAAAGGEEHELHRGPRGRRAGADGARARTPCRWPAPRPGRAGRVELAVQHRQRPGAAARWRQALPRQPRVGGRLGRRRDVGLAVRLPRARPLRRPPGPPGTTPSRRRRTCLFLQDLLDDDEAVGTLFRRLGVDPDVRPTDATRLNESSEPVSDLPAELVRAAAATTSPTNNLALSRRLGRQLPWWPDPYPGVRHA